MSGSRKWRSDVPHRGWTCISIDDTGRAEANCEMCRRERVRYLHVMEHKRHPEQLRCGCICAGHMEGDPAAARTREKSLKRKLNADARWVERGWKRSQAGNEHRTKDGTHVVIFGGGSGSWGYRVTPPGASPITRRNLPSSEAAKLDARKLLFRDGSDLEKYALAIA